MASDYPDDDQFAGLVEAATAAAERQRELGKRKRGEDVSYAPVLTEPFSPQSTHQATLSNSASVLFREPSEKSKKYSRPPLGKVFNSLELAPETFLKLQNAAKGYMLDEDHPERRDVVGHKKHNDSNDVAKLRLYECVDNFLRMDNNGNKFFGPAANLGVPDAPPRTFFWPDDHNRIIKLLMPLLRKMVTNERQRVYAATTRKSDKSKAEKKPAGQVHTEEAGDANMAEAMAAPEIDPSLQSHVHNSVDALHNEGVQMESVMLRVNIVKLDSGSSQRVSPEISIPSQAAPTLQLFIDNLRGHYHDLPDPPIVKVWLPEGLVQMKEDGEWVVSHLAPVMNEWMDHQLKIIVEV